MRNKSHLTKNQWNLWPFYMGGMDVSGPIMPKASNEYRLIFMVVDYFTKWVEAASYADVTKSTRLKDIRDYDEKVCPREFYERDLVLKRILPIQKDFRRKWIPNWKGPYVVKNAFSEGALISTDMDGKTLPNPVNSDPIKNYYTKKKKEARAKTCKGLLETKGGFELKTQERAIQILIECGVCGSLAFSELTRKKDATSWSINKVLQFF
ncbi:Gypsy retrotransposon integrase-like protein 1 [Gossypium australe]|uniref:Gypsy retrotransposon integrase-like protein 1 n=1 Tax=Gossypium australe TaxID=47621 RepID=A0A5B6UZZ1_9ROSI|nr:Gypsy retrotransposon integrase-like protein 1 [Gossypium australe]